jgi:hypothetical protein
MLLSPAGFVNPFLGKRPSAAGTFLIDFGGIFE